MAANQRGQSQMERMLKVENEDQARLFSGMDKLMSFVAKNITPSLFGNEYEKETEDLKTLVLEAAGYQYMHSQIPQVVKEVGDSMPEPNADGKIVQVDYAKEIERRLHRRERTTATERKNSAMYKEVLSCLNEGREGDKEMEEDGEEQEEQVEEMQSALGDLHLQSQSQALDPITKGPLRNPVRNRRCGHVYGRESMMQLIHANTNVRCPIVGCSNKKPVNATDLEDMQAGPRRSR